MVGNGGTRHSTINLNACLHVMQGGFYLLHRYNPHQHWSKSMFLPVTRPVTSRDTTRYKTSLRHARLSADLSALASRRQRKLPGEGVPTDLKEKERSRFMRRHSAHRNTDSRCYCAVVRVNTQ